jgi:hypothetical protein
VYVVQDCGSVKGGGIGKLYMKFLRMLYLIYLAKSAFSFVSSLFAARSGSQATRFLLSITFPSQLQLDDDADSHLLATRDMGLPQRLQAHSFPRYII